MTFEEDLPIFLDLDTFAVPAQFGALTFSVVRDDEYADAIGIEGSELYVQARQSDVDAIVGGAEDAVGTVDGTAVQIVRVESDGTGMVRLKLHEV